MSRTAAGLGVVAFLSQPASAADPAADLATSGTAAATTVERAALFSGVSVSRVGLAPGRGGAEGLTSVRGGPPVGYAFSAGPLRPFSVAPAAHDPESDTARRAGDLLRLTDRWSLTPSAGLDPPAPDIHPAAQDGSSGALASRLLLYAGRYRLWMGNAVDYSRAPDGAMVARSLDARPSNTAFVNGLLLAAPLDAMGRRYTVEYSITDTRYAGTGLYDERYDEIGISLRRSGSGLGMHWRAGLSYLNASNSDRLSVSFSYSF